MGSDELKEGLMERMSKDPFATKLGMELLEVRPGYAKVRMVTDADSCNFFGYVHGGAIFTLMDYAFSAAANSHAEVCVALNMSVQFIEAPNQNGELVAEAREVAKSRRLGLYEMIATDPAGKMIAKCDGRVFRTAKTI